MRPDVARHFTGLWTSTCQLYIRKCGNWRCIASANLKCFWCAETPETKFRWLQCIYVHYAAQPISARISSIYLLPFGKVWFSPDCWPPCATPGNEACRTQNLRRVSKNSGRIVSHLWIKVHEIWGQCRAPLVLSSVLTRLSVACFVQKTFTSKSRSRRKTEQM